MRTRPVIFHNSKAIIHKQIHLSNDRFNNFKWKLFSNRKCVALHSEINKYELNHFVYLMTLQGFM